MVSSTLKYFFIALVIAALCFYIVKQRRVEASFQTLPTRITDFTALNLSGERTTYQNERGKATFIVLSASWCPACMAEIPLLKNIYNEFSHKGLKILMISEDDNLKIAAKFKKKYQLPWKVLHWNYDTMNKLGNPGVIPVSYLINNQDSIVQIHSGIFNEDQVKKQISSILED